MSTKICTGCISGTLATGKPTGREAKIHGYPAYVATPDGDPKGIIVIFRIFLAGLSPTVAF